MPRSLQQKFKCAPLEELTHQLLFAPPAKRTEQVRRAERLHDEIDGDTPYPIEYLVYRITGYRRTAASESVLLVGEAVGPDLRLIIDKLSRSVDLTQDDQAQAETVPQVAERLGVSAKTVNRWRKSGLRWRWQAPAGGGRKQLVIPRAALDRFTEQHGDRVQRAARFTAMSTSDRDRLIEQARKIAQHNGARMTLNRVASKLADDTGRALETVRQVLEKHDREHPDAPLFPNHTGPLSPRQKRLVARAHQRGIAVRRIADHLGRSRHTVHRVLHQRRAAAARSVDLRHIHAPMFDRDDAQQVILRPESAGGADKDAPSKRPAVPVNDLPEALRPLYQRPMTDAAQQRSLFIRYNYLKHKAALARDALDPRSPRVAELDEFESWLNAAREVRGRLVRANWPTVLSVARRHLLDVSGTRMMRLFELLEAGQAVLLETLETYNAAWSNTFESYLTNRLMRHFASAQDDSARRARRRLSGEQMRRRLVRQAAAQHVALIEPAAPREGGEQREVGE